MYPGIFLDALPVKIREEGLVRIKAIYLALGGDESIRDFVRG